jgi:anti-sigma factor RsiW
VNGHLGALAAAFVDEQLDRGERDRVLRHLAACDECREDVVVQRRIKQRLDRMGEPQLPTALLNRLQSLAPESGTPVAPKRPPTGLPAAPDLLVPVRPASPVVARPKPPAGSAPSRRRPDLLSSLAARRPGAKVQPRVAATRGRWRARRVLVGAASVLLIGGGAAYAAGGSSDQSGTPVQPAVEVFTVQHGTTSGSVPLHDPAVSAVTAGFGR